MSVERDLLHLSILYEKEEDNDNWTAHCLEMDLVSQGKTKEESLAALLSIMRKQCSWALLNDNWDNIFTHAPEEYWDRFEGVKMDKLEELVRKDMTPGPYPED